jgi:excisionase family DNA binding protein
VIASDAPELAGRPRKRSKMPKNHQIADRRALSIRETASACGLSRATLYRQIKDGKLATIKVGARRLVPVASIDALLKVGVQ